MISWRELTTFQDLEGIVILSNQVPVVIFKHSTRCGISAFVKQQLEHDWDLSDEVCPVYYLNLIKHRDLSNELAKAYQVMHQSPQVLIIRHGKCIYHTSHHAIDAKTISRKLSLN